MEILVCIKPVPDPEQYDSLRIDPETKRLVREGIPTVINPADKNALEEALRIREACGGRITVLTMAPAEAGREKLLESLAMGADRGYLLSDAVFGGADTYATSYVLAEAVRKIEAAETTEPGVKNGTFHLILTGNESADGATAHVPAQLAAWLGLPHLCGVNEIRVDENSLKETGLLRVWKKTEEGRAVFEGAPPAVLAVTRDINKPRLINAMGIIKAKRKPLTVWSNGDLGLEMSRIGLAGSTTQPGELLTPDLSRKAEALGEDPAEAAERILAIMEKAGVSA